MDRDSKYILWFNETGIDDVPLVGGKNASLGEMYRNLTKKGVNVPNGFSIRTLLQYSDSLSKSTSDNCFTMRAKSEGLTDKKKARF